MNMNGYAKIQRQNVVWGLTKEVISKKESQLQIQNAGVIICSS